MLGTLNHLYSWYNSATKEKKSELLKILCSECEINGGNPTFTWINGFDVFAKLGGQQLSLATLRSQ